MNTEAQYINHPLYFGNPVRYKGFLEDLKEVMTNKSAKYTETDFIAFIIDKYELRHAIHFNIKAYGLLLYTIHTYYKKYIKLVEDKNAKEGNPEEDMDLLRQTKGL